MLSNAVDRVAKALARLETLSYRKEDNVSRRYANHLKYLLLFLVTFSGAVYADDMAREPVKVVLSHSKAKKLGFIIEERSLPDGRFYFQLNSPDVLKNGEIYRRFGNALDEGIKREREFLGVNMALMDSSIEIAYFKAASIGANNLTSISVNPELISHVNAYVYYEYYDGLEAPIALQYEIRSKTKKLKK